MYVRDPQEIYRQSFATVEAETALERFPPSLRPVVIRLVHACGMPEIAEDIAFNPGVADAARAALAAGAPVLCDCAMVRHGVIARGLAGNSVTSLLDHPDTAAQAAAEATTRSAAAMGLAAGALRGAVVAIGNAPTALFRLLELLDEGAAPPAAILAFPVGFVGAAESKAALAGAGHGVPFLTLLGRRGGSAMAAAAVNGLSLGLAGDGT